MKTLKKGPKKLLRIHNSAFLELPIRPKIDFPYWKLGWGTLCSFYFVHSSNLRKSLELWKKCNFLNFCVFYVLKKGLKSANFPRIQTFSQIETLYG
jgi:hypothetical protein